LKVKRSRDSRVATTLREWRRETDHTQADIARIVGCSLGAVKNWEQGWRVPGRDINSERLWMARCAKLAEAYGVEVVDVYELLGGYRGCQD
jgi:transcriptional regulator with XRE-family HTH domain